jgi:hypothetical protein
VTLFALPSALAAVDPRLSAPPGLSALPALAARWRAHRAQTSELLGDAVIDALSSRLRRHLRPQLGDPGPISAQPTGHGARVPEVL